jgi:tRNA-2-methylthio-N6-dimethylallyladenosine synthase
MFDKRSRKEKRGISIMRYYLETFGCQMNSSDSEIIRGSLEETGYEPVESPDRAEIILLNTCAVREHAEVRAIGRLTDLYRYKKNGQGRILGILGCIAQQYGGEMRSIVPGIDIVVGPDNYRELPGILGDILRGDRDSYQKVRLDRSEMYDGIRPRRINDVTAWVQVMRGCDRFCSYCIVPYVRGRERSRNFNEILEEVAEIVSSEICEIVLLGQNVNAYNHNGIDFPELLRRLSRVDGIRRVRFITSHPLNITKELVGVIRDRPSICKALHLPLQSGSDRVLNAMNRGYTLSEYREKIDLLRHEIADIALSTDLMVGFPGESENDFFETIEAAKKIEFDNAYMFKYSPRKGTRAAELSDQVDHEVASGRLSKLISFQREITAKKNRELVGLILPVLVEGVAKKGDGMFLARTEGDKMVVFRGNGGSVGSLLNVRVVDMTGTTLIGELCDVQEKAGASPEEETIGGRACGSSGY